MTEIQRRYLETLVQIFAGGPSGIEALVHAMNVSRNEVVDKVEPFLLSSELIFRTWRGRCATAKAFRLIKASLIAEQDDNLLSFPQE